MERSNWSQSGLIKKEIYNGITVKKQEFLHLNYQKFCAVGMSQTLLEIKVIYFSPSSLYSAWKVGTILTSRKISTSLASNT